MKQEGKIIVIVLWSRGRFELFFKELGKFMIFPLNLDAHVAFSI